ncbi:Chitin synthase regulatory factor 4 [Yarrowia sp. E02]|nr:Chitin synthase regulatory factor 4 [Yarrowia sp. E02]
MEHFTARDGSFQFPDSLFPEVQTPYPALPAAPTDKIETLKSVYETSILATQTGSGSSQHLSQFFRWARDVLDLHELHHGLGEAEVAFAKTVVQHTAHSETTEGVKSPFTGAAYYLMGLASLFGSSETSTALEHFKQAAANGFARSYYRLAVEFESRGDAVHWKECLDRGAARGDSACCFRLAMALFQGQLGLQRDPNLAYELLQSSAKVSDPDSPQPSYVLGLLLLGELPAIRIDGCAELEEAVSSPTPQSLHMAFKNLERSAWLGFAPAQIRMGRAWQGGGKGFDSSIALRYFHHASRHYLYQCWRQKDISQTSGEAELEVSKWFLSGCELHLEANEPWAFRFGHVAAQAGNTTAEFALGYFYEVGISVKKSTLDAKYWYTEALRHGFTEARDRIDNMEECPLDKSHHQKKLSLRRSNTKRLKDEFKEKLRSNRGGRPMRSYSVADPEYQPSGEVTMELQEVEEGVEEGETMDKAVEKEDVSALNVPVGSVMASLQNLQLKDTAQSAVKMLGRIKEMKLEEDRRVEQERREAEKERAEKAAAEKAAEEKAEKEAKLAEEMRLAEEKLEEARLAKEEHDRLVEQAREEENARRELEAQRLAEALEQGRLEMMEEERLQKERLEKELLEKERLEKEKEERLELERQEQERLIQLHEKQRKQKEKEEKREKLRREKEEQERLEKERQEKERQEKERQEKERQEKLEQDRFAEAEAVAVSTPEPTSESSTRELGSEPTSESSSRYSSRPSSQPSSQPSSEPSSRPTSQYSSRPTTSQSTPEAESDKYKEEQRRLRKEHKRALKKRAQSERLSAPVQPPPPAPSSIPSTDLRREKMLQNVRQRVSSESVGSMASGVLPLLPAPVAKQRVSSMIIDTDETSKDESAATTPTLAQTLRDIVIPQSNTSSRSSTPHSGHSTPRKPVSRSGTDTDLAGRVVMNNLANNTGSPELRGRRHERARTAHDVSADVESPQRLCSPASVGGAAGGAAGDAGGKRLVSTPAGVASAAPSTPAGMGPGAGPYADYSPPVPPKDSSHSSPFDRSTYFDRSLSPTKNRPSSPSARISSLSAVEISHKLKKFAGKIVPSSPPKRDGEFEPSMMRPTSSRSMSPVKDRVASTPNPGRPMSALSAHSHHSDPSRSSSPVDSIMSHSRSSTMMTSSSAGSSGHSMLGGFIPNMTQYAQCQAATGQQSAQKPAVGQRHSPTRTHSRGACSAANSAWVW